MVVERDKNGKLLTADVNVYDQDITDDGQVKILNDGGDIGPTELQNNVIDEETYDAVVDLGETSHVGLENDQQAADELTRAVR